jgi:hypothetical protein
VKKRNSFILSGPLLAAVEDKNLRIWRTAANISIRKIARTANKGWSSRLGVRQRLTTIHHKKQASYRNFTQEGTETGEDCTMRSLFSSSNSIKVTKSRWLTGERHKRVGDAKCVYNFG